MNTRVIWCRENLIRFNGVYFQLQRFRAFLRGNRSCFIILTQCYIFNVIFMLYKLLHCVVTFIFRRSISVSCSIKMILNEHVNFIYFCVQTHLWSQGKYPFFTYCSGKNILFTSKCHRKSEFIFPKMFWTLHWSWYLFFRFPSGCSGWSWFCSFCGLLILFWAPFMLQCVWVIF